MNLTDLQVELRDIEEHISQLHFEIEKMKPKANEDRKTYFDNITKIAKRYPITHLMISSEPKEIQRKFIMSMANLLVFEETDLYNRLLYLSRISYGCKLELSAEDIYKLGLEYELEDIEILCNELLECKYNYIIEALIIANISGESPNAMLSAIADMAKVLGIDNEVMRVLALVSKSILTGNLDLIDDMPVPSENMWSGKLRDYVSEDWVIKRRKKCVSICIEQNTESSNTSPNSDAGVFEKLLAYSSGIQHEKNHEVNSPCSVVEKANDGIIVHKGDVILTYEESVKKEIKKTGSKSTSFASFFTNAILDNESNTTKERRTVTAPCDGILFFVEQKGNGKVNKYLEAYVVSYFDDYKEFCEWHKKQR